MEGVNKNIEKINLDTKICSLVEILCNKNNYQGDKPLEIKLKNDNSLLYLQIRKGEDWIIIQYQDSKNLGIVITYNFEKKNDKWSYIDTNKIKYNTTDPKTNLDLNFISSILEESIKSI